MRYELYSYRIKDQAAPYIYEMESEDIEDVLEYKEMQECERDRRFVIVDNFSAGSIDHCQLGFKERPMLNEMIQRVLKCKFSKFVREIVFTDSMEAFERSCAKAIVDAKRETLYFFKLNAFLGTADIERIYDYLDEIKNPCT